MGNIDIAILVILGLGAVQGLFKGFILSVTSLFGLVLGFYLSLRFAWYVENILREATGYGETPLMHLLAFALCFLLVIIITYIIGKSIEKMLEMASLGCLNRVGGALFGIFKGVVLVSAIIYVIELADRHSYVVKKETKEASIFYKPMAEVVPSLVPQVKKGLKLFKPETQETSRER